MTGSGEQTFLFEQNPTRVANSERDALLANPGFGRVFTDHMATIRYSEGRGWHDAKIGPRKAFDLDPSTLVLHYAQEIFEGMKAYRLPDGGATLFRPDANARRSATPPFGSQWRRCRRSCSSNPCANWFVSTATGYPPAKEPRSIFGRS